MTQSVNQYAKEIDLSNQGIKDVLNIAKFIANNPYLEYIDLSNNEIDNQGIKYIAKALEHNNKLEVLNLNFNNIGLQGYKSLAKALSKNAKLKALLAISNDNTQDLEPSIREFVKWGVNNTTLIELKLEHLYRDDRIERILDRNRDLDWPNVKNAILQVATTLYPIDIPPYVILEIIDRMGYEDVPEIKKIEIIQKVEAFVKRKNI